MKKFLSIFAVMILGSAFMACDFGSSDDDTTTPDDDTYTEGDEYTEDDSGGGGYENVWDIVYIKDSPDNVYQKGCFAGNPGADIDAVEFYRDGDIVGWAESVELLDNAAWDATDWPCPNEDNDKDDPDEMLGTEDGQADDGVYEGYFSLNGRAAYLLMSDVMENGDELVIYEMWSQDTGDVSKETYQVYLGYYAEDGDIAVTPDAFADWNTGMVSGIIDGLW
ncbi:MAG: hypothetical protein ABIK09_16170 [Pseudomonadota bacterium]